MNIAATLISWYQSNKRDLPWRSTRDPYKIWLSEIILQQTRVSQGLDYYYRFQERFPDVTSLAKASEEEVLKLWQGLGYYSRARNLHDTARRVVDEWNGVFPTDSTGLLKLKGIGEYTAAAIASISYNEVVPVVDGNVARVLSRLFALEFPIDTHSGQKKLRQIAGELIPFNEPATFNQAIMEFGAQQCKPLNPDCEGCPLKLECQACSQKRVSRYPIKQNRTHSKETYYHYLVITFPMNNEDYILLHRRERNGIWKNLYDFPLIESEKALDLSQIIENDIVTSIIDRLPLDRVSSSPNFTHQLSHRRIFARFIRIQISQLPGNIMKFIPVPVREIRKYPIPRLIERYVNTLF